MVGFCISRRQERIGWTRKTVSWVSLCEGKVSHDQEMASNLAKFYHLLRNVTQENLITALLRWQRTFLAFFFFLFFCLLLELATQMRDEMSAVTSKRKLEEVVPSYKNTVACKRWWASLNMPDTAWEFPHSGVKACDLLRWLASQRSQHLRSGIPSRSSIWFSASKKWQHLYDLGRQWTYHIVSYIFYQSKQKKKQKIYIYFLYFNLFENECIHRIHKWRTRGRINKNCKWRLSVNLQSVKRGFHLK